MQDISELNLYIGFMLRTYVFRLVIIENNKHYIMDTKVISPSIVNTIITKIIYQENVEHLPTYTDFII